MRNYFVFAISVVIAMLFADSVFAQCNECALNGPGSLTQGQTTTYATSAVSGSGYYWSATGAVSVVSSPTGSSASIRANTTGTGKVCVTRYRAGSEPCCKCRTVSVVSGSPGCLEPNFVLIAQTQTGACYNGIFEFTASRQPANSVDGTYNWSVFQGTLLSGQGTNKVTVQFPTPTISLVTVTLTSNCNNKQVSSTIQPIYDDNCGGGLLLLSPNVYPNPSGNVLNVEVPQGTEGPAPAFEVDIVNEQGEVVFSKKASGSKQQFDISSLPEGRYFVRTRSNGKVIKTTRLLKEK